MEKMKCVEIPESLYRSVEQKIQDTDFPSVSEFVTYIVRESIPKLSKREPLSKEEEEAIKRRLKSLGYI